MRCTRRAHDQAASRSSATFSQRSIIGTTDRRQAPGPWVTVVRSVDAAPAGRCGRGVAYCPVACAGGRPESAVSPPGRRQAPDADIVCGGHGQPWRIRPHAAAEDSPAPAPACRSDTPGRFAVHATERRAIFRNARPPPRAVHTRLHVSATLTEGLRGMSDARDRAGERRRRRPQNKNDRPERMPTGETKRKGGCQWPNRITS